MDKSSEINMKPSQNENSGTGFDIQTTPNMSIKTQLIPEGNISGTQSLVLHRTNTQTSLVKNDFFRTSYPSLNNIIGHVDSVISRIKPVTFRPPSYLDESLAKPMSTVHEAHVLRETVSKSFFMTLRDSLVKFQVSQNIPSEAYNFISLMTTICTLGCKAIHTIFIMIMALFPMIEIFVHISRFLIDHLLDIFNTANRQEKMRKWLIFFIEIGVIFCLVIFIFGSVLLPLWSLGILIVYKIMCFFTV